MAELRVKSTGTLKLFESDNTSSVTIASPASLGGDRTVTLPDASVTLASGTMLATDGDGSSLTGLPDNTPSFSVRLSGDQTISATTWTKAQLASEQWDSDSAFDSATNYRFTVPTGEGGKYLFSFLTYINSLPDTTRAEGTIYLNGVTSAYTNVICYMGGTAGYYPVGSSSILNLSADDYVELYVKHWDSVDRPLLVGRTSFSGFKLAGV